MKLFLDDTRNPKWEYFDDWLWVKTYTEAVKLLETGEVTEISLDHDLGDSWMFGSEADGKTGYDVACWIEQAVLDGRIKRPIMHCHSMNPPGRIRIMAVINKLETNNG